MPFAILPSTAAPPASSWCPRWSFWCQSLYAEARSGVWIAAKEVSWFCFLLRPSFCWFALCTDSPRWASLSPASFAGPPAISAFILSSSCPPANALPHKLYHTRWLSCPVQFIHLCIRHILDQSSCWWCQSSEVAPLLASRVLRRLPSCFRYAFQLLFLPVSIVGEGTWRGRECWCRWRCGRGGVGISSTRLLSFSRGVYRSLRFVPSILWSWPRFRRSHSQAA